MNITVIGTGYVGLVTGACLAEVGNNVTCVDSDRAKIQALEAGHIPLYEPGLEALVQRNVKERRLQFVTRLQEAIEDHDVYMIAVGTPPNEDGSAQLGAVLGVAEELGECVSSPCVVVTKSTVPVGTTEQVEAKIRTALARRGLDIAVDVVSNPEFLKEGDAVGDFMRPERIIVGTESARALQVMKELYAPVTRSHERLIAMTVRDAEFTKYAANAMLATRISFMNELAAICERVGVDIENVRVGIGSDRRIGYQFIYPGCGYGGSCFPKDVKALIRTALDNGVEPQLLQSVDRRNSAQKRVLFEKIHERFSRKLDGLVFGVWGLAFKPGTDDMREAPAIPLLEGLIQAGAKVRAYDPVAHEMAARVLPSEWFESGQLELAEHQYDALEGADGLVLVTEWKPFRQPDLRAMRRIMRQHVVFDGRNQYDPDQMAEAGFEYFGIGRRK
ncbi:MAG: nucleotide sugar dehydrogenase [Betaproteobacteria bacterium]|nr:nucleotide sugar dehydrogenase [Betaproteobacteria bacterium]